MVNRKFSLILLLAGVLVTLNRPAPAQPLNLPSAPKWARFEITLKSSRSYSNPLRDAEVRVLFVSPLGETNRVYGFWDGGKTWRVRYQPSFAGRWTYYTMCSDTANSGLHEQRGEFLCTAPKGGDRFSVHGPIQVARGDQHFEHADRTPFLWLGDAAWNAAAKSAPADWAEYVKTRAGQKFNVVQWKLPAAAYTGRPNISLNLDLFRQLEARLEAANQAGLLNAIVPLWEIGASANANLPEAQAIALLRYCVARWGADHVAWILAFEADNTGEQAARWQRIGRAVFGPVAHAPVVLLPGESTWVLDSFRAEPWVNAFGLQTVQVTDEDALPWLLKGPLALERKKSPPKPLLALSPAPETTSPATANADLARRVLWWNLLLNSPAGVSSSALDVAEWTTSSNVTTEQQPWHRALLSTGARAIAPLSDCFAGREFWRLQPLPSSVLNQTETSLPRNQPVVAATENHRLLVVYVPEDRTVQLATRALPAQPQAVWFNPQSGDNAKVSATTSATSVSFATPTAGEWLLILKAGK